MMESAIADQELNRVRANTSPEILAKIEAQIAHNIRFYAAQPPDVIAERIEQLEKEWSLERWLEVNISTIGLSTLLLALTKNRTWGLVTSLGLGFFLLHSLQGFDPPLPWLRRLGVRTRGEIDRELYALKALRGDVPAPSTLHPAAGDNEKGEAALRAVSKG
jgi:hypothetical protein